MPFYQWMCEVCGKKEGTYAYSTAGCRLGPICHSTMMARDYHGEHVPHDAANGFPLTTKNIDGTPRTFNDAASYRAACKKAGLVLRDDPGYLDDEVVQGPRGPEMNRGTGRGHKGQWI